MHVPAEVPKFTMVLIVPKEAKPKNGAGDSIDNPQMVMSVGEHEVPRLHAVCVDAFDKLKPRSSMT